MTTKYAIEYKVPQTSGGGALALIDKRSQALQFVPVEGFAEVHPLFITKVTTEAGRYNRERLYKWHRDRKEWILL